MSPKPRIPRIPTQMLLASVLALATAAGSAAEQTPAGLYSGGQTATQQPGTEQPGAEHIGGESDYGQTDAGKIDRAMRAAPPAVSARATIVDLDGRVLREGDNGWVCQPGVMPGDDHPMCNDAAWTAFMRAVAAGEPVDAQVLGISYMLQGDMKVNNADPFDREQDPGEVWVQEGPHLMIYVPDVALLEGLPTDPYAGGPYVMWHGTPYAHVMVPVDAAANVRPAP
jgi:hypothetical protein